MQSWENDPPALLLERTFLLNTFGKSCVCSNKKLDTTLEGNIDLGLPVGATSPAAAASELMRPEELGRIASGDYKPAARVT